MPEATIDRVWNVMLVGVGGQGVVLASDILAAAALESGLDVKKSEIHGMSQRGGSVFSHVRFGPTVHSPTIPYGEVDVLSRNAPMASRAADARGIDAVLQAGAADGG